MDRDMSSMLAQARQAEEQAQAQAGCAAHASMHKCFEPRTPTPGMLKCLPTYLQLFGMRARGILTLLHAHRVQALHDGVPVLHADALRYERVNDSIRIRRNVTLIVCEAHGGMQKENVTLIVCKAHAGMQKENVTLIVCEAHAGMHKEHVTLIVCEAHGGMQKENVTLIVSEAHGGMQKENVILIVCEAHGRMQKENVTLTVCVKLMEECKKNTFECPIQIHAAAAAAAAAAASDGDADGSFAAG
eukprot:1159247-Pelagomonas_calceolata.AAC.7